MGIFTDPSAYNRIGLLESAVFTSPAKIQGRMGIQGGGGALSHCQSFLCCLIKGVASRLEATAGEQGI